MNVCVTVCFCSKFDETFPHSLPLSLLGRKRLSNAIGISAIEGFSKQNNKTLLAKWALVSQQAFQAATNRISSSTKWWSEPKCFISIKLKNHHSITIIIVIITINPIRIDRLKAQCITRHHLRVVSERHHHQNHSKFNTETRNTKQREGERCEE